MAVKSILVCDNCDKQLGEGGGYELKKVARRNQVIFIGNKYQPDPAGGSDGHYPELAIDLCYSCATSIVDSLAAIAGR